MEFEFDFRELFIKVTSQECIREAILWNQAQQSKSIMYILVTRGLLCIYY